MMQMLDALPLVVVQRLSTLLAVLIIVVCDGNGVLCAVLIQASGAHTKLQTVLEFCVVGPIRSFELRLSSWRGGWTDSHQHRRKGNHWVCRARHIWSLL